MKLLLIFCFLSIIIETHASLWVQITNPSTVIAKYTCISKLPCSLQVNNSKYRESTIHPHQTGLFPLFLRPGIYYFQSHMENVEIIPKSTIVYSNYNLQDVVYPPHTLNVISKLYFTISKKSQINILSQFTPQSMVSNNSYHFNIYLNQQLLHSEKNKFFWKYQTQMVLPKGVYQLVLSGSSDVDYWGNLPSMHNGFYNGRYNAIIINPLPDKSKTVTSVPNSISISHSVSHLNVNSLPASFFKKHLYQVYKQ